VSVHLEIKGGCHCRSLRYVLQWPITSLTDGELPSVPARRCSCSFCKRLDGVWTSHPQASLHIAESPEQSPSRYRFGTETADFLFCSRCGITPLVTCELEGQDYGVVNVHTFDDDCIDQIALDLSDSCFDDESTDARLERRKLRWIGNMTWA